jgi:predicted RNA-binding Zn-ribbon protein involved in translation (DUF1610 family)
MSSNVAIHITGLVFRCPFCGNENIHKPSHQQGSIYQEYGTSRLCNGCGRDYYLAIKPKKMKNNFGSYFKANVLR